MRTAGPAPAVSWRKRSRKRPRCPFVSYKPPAAPPSEGTRRGWTARPEEAAEEGLPVAPGLPRRSGPLGPHACPPALPEPQVWGRRGAPLGEWAGGARGPCASAAERRAPGDVWLRNRPSPGHGRDPVESQARSGSGRIQVLVCQPGARTGSGGGCKCRPGLGLGLGSSPRAGFNLVPGAC